MLPIYLKIEGLYAYGSPAQEIYFDNLLEAGLFGIFGKVGSGKSSIIEAITFALYGKIERLNRGDLLHYNLMNLKSNTASIIFEFSNFENRIFRFEVLWKRSKKDHEEVALKYRNGYEKINNEWTMLPSNDAGALIQLSYENFSRTIIIQQGKFKEFLELGGTDRTKMMKEIFGLQRFDLSDKVKNLYAQNDQTLAILNGKLSEFEMISSIEIESLENSINVQNAHLQTVQIKFDNSKTSFENIQKAKQISEDLNVSKTKFELLKDQKHNVDLRAKRLHIYENIYVQFSEPLKKKSKINSEIELNTKQLNLKQLQYSSTKAAYEAIQSDLSNLKPQFDQLEVYKTTLVDWQHILKIKNNQLLIQSKTESIEKGNFYQWKENELSLLKSIENINQEIGSLKNKKLDTNVLIQIGTWYHTQQTILKIIKELDEKLLISDKTLLESITTFTDSGYDVANYQSQIATLILKNETDLEQLHSQKISLEVVQKMAAYSHALEDGKPCPLCGSLTHPDIISADHNTELMANFSNQIERLKIDNSKLDQQKTILNNLYSKIEFYSKGQEALATEKKNMQEKLAAHISTFCWVQYDHNDFNKFEIDRNQSLQIENEINDLEATLRLLQIQFSENKTVLEKSELKIKAYNDEISNLLAINIDVASAITILNAIDYENESVDTVAEHIARLQALIQYIIQENIKLSDQLNILLPLLASQKTEVKLLTENTQKLADQLSEINQVLDELILKNEKYSIAEINEILNQIIDIQSEREAINKFTIQFETQKNELDNLSLVAQQNPFEIALFDILKIELEGLKAELNQEIKQLTELNFDLKNKQEKFKQKAHLLKEKDQLELRNTDLQTLKKMFDKNGFVNYVSRIYLENLCSIANHRFQRFTNNSLLLAIDEDNNFVVVDYLNEGKRRSVKTLSGGQGFQASLSLALALAESVQSLNKADKNFFFIDEGFGTQDVESVNTVFETLLNLHKENRIVGVISHVDELKEKIPKSITIINDKDQGSKIFEN